jgi:hypothetical protein
MASDRPGTVFIGEDFGDEPHELSGRFTAHWEASEGPEHRDGPEGVPVEEAIAWGRGEADVVLVRVGDEDQHYSAGARQPPPVEGDEDDFPEWPDGKRVERRRLPGMEHLDLVADEPIAWQVRLPRRVSAVHAERDAERLREALARDDAVSELRCDLERDVDRADVVLRFTVLARTHHEAMMLVFAIEDRSTEHVRYPVEQLPDRPGWVMAEPGWDPTDDIRPLPI